MKGYEGIRDKLKKSENPNVGLDRGSLSSMRSPLRTRVNSGGEFDGLKPVLFYLYAEPDTMAKKR